MHNPLYHIPRFNLKLAANGEVTERSEPEQETRAQSARIRGRLNDEDIWKLDWIDTDLGQECRRFKNHSRAPSFERQGDLHQNQDLYNSPTLDIGIEHSTGKVSVQFSNLEYSFAEL